MPTSIGEYLGRRTDIDDPPIYPSALKPKVVPTCPFMGKECSKLKGKLSLHPVCSLRAPDGRPWIVCTDRLIPAKANAITAHHISILAGVANLLFPGINVRDIGFRRQQEIRLKGKKKVVLDYAIRTREIVSGVRSKAILEIQGGGESSSTGNITRHVVAWSKENPATNEFLRQGIPTVGIIPNNAWKRQLEQIFRKVAVARRFDAGFALVMGEVLYDYVIDILGGGREYFPGWDVSLFSIGETLGQQPGAIAIDRVNKASFVTYDEFIRAVSNFPMPKTLPDPFGGDFTTLTNEEFSIIPQPSVSDDEVEVALPYAGLEEVLIDDSVVDDDGEGGGAIVNNPDPETSY